MYILIGNKTELKKDVWYNKTVCPSCKRESDFHLQRLVRVASVFFIPVVSVTQRRYLECDTCGWGKELSRKQYKEAKEQHIKSLENNEIPKEVVLEDYKPENLKFGWTVFKMILMSFLTLWVLITNIVVFSGSLSSKDIVSALFGEIVFTATACIVYVPFVNCLKNFLLTLKKKKAYKSAWYK